MTRKEAITYLEDAKSDLPYKFGQALDMAISALQAPTDGDLISRAEVLFLIDDAWVRGTNLCTADWLVDEIKSLPSNRT